MFQQDLMSEKRLSFRGQVLEWFVCLHSLFQHLRFTADVKRLNYWHYVVSISWMVKNVFDLMFLFVALLNQIFNGCYKSPKNWDTWLKMTLGSSKYLSYSWIFLFRPPHLCLHPAEWFRRFSCGVSLGWAPQLVQGRQPGGQISPPQHYAYTLVSSYWNNTSTTSVKVTKDIHPSAAYDTTAKYIHKYCPWVQDYGTLH